MKRIGAAALLFAGAFAGGFVANRTIPLVHAQTLPTPAFRGNSVTILDQQNKVQAILRSTANGAELTMNDADGKSRVNIGPSGIVIRDGRGRTLWASPRTGFMPASE
jgi:hypothetical protein